MSPRSTSKPVSKKKIGKITKTKKTKTKKIKRKNTQKVGGKWNEDNEDTI